MGRPEKPIQRQGRVAELGRQVRLLREQAGLTLREVRDRTGLSMGTLSNTQGGEILPTWNVLSKFVAACGGDLDDWRERWEQANHISRLPRAVRIDNEKLAVPPAATDRWTWSREVARRLAGPPPLPITVHSTADFIEYLQRLKIWAGDPPVREMAKKLGIPPSTLHDLLRKNTKLPSEQQVCLFLAGCGVTDANVVREWMFAWRRIRFSEYQSTPTRRRHLMSA